MPAPVVRTLHHLDFPVERLVTAKRGRSVSVCLPARDEEGTIGGIVSIIRRELVEHHPLVDEVLVVDDGSKDGTAAVARGAGARVVPAASVLADHGTPSGKGAAMWKGVFTARGELIAFLDADVRNFGPRFVTGLLGPLLLEDDVRLVKACYTRPLDGRPGEGGRVTELVARPLISLLFPHLSGVAQPLAGECAARRETLERVPFAQGYGVELALLVDVAARFGVGSIAQVDLGTRVHRNRRLDELSPQAFAIIRTALARAGIPTQPDRASLLLRPGHEPLPVPTVDCPPLVELPSYHRRSA